MIVPPPGKNYLTLTIKNAGDFTVTTTADYGYVQHQTSDKRTVGFSTDGLESLTLVADSYDLIDIRVVFDFEQTEPVPSCDAN